MEGGAAIPAEIYDLLHRLGVTANYIGYHYTAYALALCIQQPERLLLVTKCLYPDVSKRYKTNWKAVERSLRIVGHVIWRENRPLLERLAHRSLTKKPCNAQLLAILTSSLDTGPLEPCKSGANDRRDTFAIREDLRS